MAVGLKVALCGCRVEIAAEVAGADVVSFEDFGDFLLGSIEEGLRGIESYELESGSGAALVDDKGGRRDGNREFCSASLCAFLEGTQGFFCVLGEMLKTLLSGAVEQG